MELANVSAHWPQHRGAQAAQGGAGSCLVAAMRPPRTCCWCLSLKASVPAFWSYLTSYCPDGDVTDEVAVLMTSEAAVEARSRALVLVVVVVRSTVVVACRGGAGGGGSGGGGPAGQQGQVP
jgi:hypothetical protein